MDGPFRAGANLAQISMRNPRIDLSESERTRSARVA